MKNIIGQSEKENHNKNELLAIELLKVAKSDVKASEVLYENRLFSQSYFHFQQATEKATKALVLFLEMGNAKKTFKVRHDVFKLHKDNFLKAIEEKQKALDLVKALPFFETSGMIKTKKIKEQLDNSAESINLFEHMRELDLINIPANDISLFLNNIESLEQKSVLMPADLEKRIDDLFMPFVNKMELNNSKAAQHIAKELKAAFASKEFGGFIREHFADVIKSFVHILYAQSVLYFSGYLTIQHSSISRYPHTDDPKKNPLSVYNKKLPVVKYQPLFLQHLKKAIKVIEEYT